MSLSVVSSPSMLEESKIKEKSPKSSYNVQGSSNPILIEDKWIRDDFTLDFNSYELCMFASIPIKSLFIQSFEENFLEGQNMLQYRNKLQKEFPQDKLQDFLARYGINKQCIEPEQPLYKLIELCEEVKFIEGGMDIETYCTLKHYFTKFLQEHSMTLEQSTLIQDIIDQCDDNINRANKIIELEAKGWLLENKAWDDSEDYSFYAKLCQRYQKIYDQWEEDICMPMAQKIFEDVNKGKQIFFTVSWPGHILGARAFKQGEFYNIELANAGWGVDNQDPEISLSSSDGKIFVEYTTQDPKIFQTQLKNIFLISDALREDYFDLQDCYQALRDNMQENLKSISRPLQKVGNCYFRNILESIMRVIETQGERELVNDFYVFFEDKLKQKQVYPALQAQLNELSLPKFNHHVSPYEPIDLVA